MVGTGLGTDNEIEVVVSARDRISRKLHAIRTNLVNTAAKVGVLATALGGALAAGGLAVATKAAADFETAMVEVEKVTNPETAREMGDAVREMARRMPLGQEALAGIAADAGRFGVRGVENMRAFTESVARMATATDLNAEQAGESFARLATLTNTPISEMENLGSSINTLSNNFATSAGEIVDSMLRSSAAMSQLGLSNTQMVGLSGALNEVSESAERAGTRLRRVAQEMLDPRNTEDLAAALGVSTEEFERMRKKAPMETLKRMVELMRDGGDGADALRKTLSTASQQALAGLAQNFDGMQEALELSNSSFEEGTSLQEEFDAATDTFNSRLKILKNNLNEIAITIGNAVLPMLNPLLDQVNALLSSVDDLGVTTENTSAVFSTAMESIRSTAVPILQDLQGFWAEWGDDIMAAARTIQTAIETVIGRAFQIAQSLWETHGKRLFGDDGEIQQTLQALKEFWAEWGDEITAVVRFIFETVATIAKVGADLLFTALTVLLNVIQGDWEEAWSAIGGFFERTFQSLLGFASKWGKALIDALIGALPKELRGAVRNAIGAVGDITAPQLSANLPAPSARGGRRDVVERRQVIKFEGGEDAISQAMAEAANRQMSNERRSADRLAGRPSGL